MKNISCWSIDKPIREDYLIFGSPLILNEEIEEVIATLRSGWLGTGPKVAEFEANFRDYIGSRYSVAVNSCTAALHLALMAIALKSGDEVIVPSLTFAASANVVIHAGGRPVFADVNRRTMCIDPEDVAKKITSNTKAIIPVHFAGRPCQMKNLIDLAKDNNLRIIEDCAHAIETLYHGEHVGTLGNLAAFSFYVTKNLVTGEGGMLTTKDEYWANRIKILALHGMSADAWERFSDKGYKHYEVTEPGYKYNMMDIQASLGIHQLKRIEKNLLRRQEIWQQYDESFSDIPVFLPSPEEEGTRHARHLYTLILDIDKLRVSRDTIQEALHHQKIGTGIHYRALHLHRFYREKYGYASGDLPVSSWISERTLSLPLSPKLSDQDVNDVILSVRNTVKYFEK